MVGRKGRIDYSGKTEDSRVSRFFELYKLGKTDKEIETETGSTHMMIYNWRRRFGLRKNQRIQPETVREVSKNDLNYIAGFLDGEGCVSLRKRKDNKYFAPVIEFSNTNLDVLKFIRERLGLTVNVNIHESGCRGNRKMTYKFAIKGWRNCLHVAKLLFPYSLVKKKRLYILIKFIERRTDKFFMNTPYDRTDWDYYHAIFRLNRTGIVEKIQIADIEIEKDFIPDKRLEENEIGNMNYIAGFFDGEGYVGINKKFRPIITFTNTNKEVLGFIKDKIESENNIYFINSKSLKHKNKYTLNITSNGECLSLAEKLLPYSIVRKKRLELLIEILELKSENIQNELKKEDALRLFEQMKLLNHRGL